MCHASLIFHRGLENYLLEWPSPKDSLLIEHALKHNYYIWIGAFALIDLWGFYATSFDFFVYLIIFNHQSLGLAMKELMNSYTRQVIETQISFSSSLSLQKDETFHRRLRKLNSLFYYLGLSSVVTNVFIFWLFYYSSYTHLAFLLYPVSLLCDWTHASVRESRI